MTFLELCIFSAAFLVTYAGVRIYRAWSLKRGVLDHPNERSSHDVPTPRGGGLVIAIVVLSVYLGFSSLIGYAVQWGFAVGAIMIVIVSLLDDIFSISFAWRLAVHSIAAAVVVYSCGHITLNAGSPQSFSSVIDWLGAIITFGWVVWTLNAYNFMDGIDGIAGVQAVTASVGWLIIALYFGEPAILTISGTVLFASGAFLLHNWPPARIFMGDAGSAFLGFLLACIPLMMRPAEAKSVNLLVIAAVSLLWMFVFDSVLTFIRRAARGEKVWNAHREHLYQRLVRSGCTHRTVTLTYGGLSATSASAAVYAILSENPMRLAVLITVLVACSLTVVAFCWKRRCLSGEIV